MEPEREGARSRLRPVDVGNTRFILYKSQFDEKVVGERGDPTAQ